MAAFWRLSCSYGGYDQNLTALYRFATDLNSWGGANLGHQPWKLGPLPEDFAPGVLHGPVDNCAENCDTVQASTLSGSTALLSVA